MKRFWLRFKLAYYAFRLRESTAYWALLQGHPVNTNCIVYGTIETTHPYAVFKNCTVNRPDGKGDGFRVSGHHSIILGCTATGWSGYGLNVAGVSNVTDNL